MGNEEFKYTKFIRAILMVNSSSNPKRIQYFQHTVSIGVKIQHIFRSYYLNETMLKILYIK